MSWKDILKTEKAHCGSEKLDDEEEPFEKLTGNQDRIDANKDGKISGEDFKLLRDKKVAKKMKSDSQIEKEILAEIKKEGGALGMKNLKAIAPRKDLLRVLNAMLRKKVIYQHNDGDIYTHKPSKGRGFTA